MFILSIAFLFSLRERHGVRDTLAEGNPLRVTDLIFLLLDVTDADPQVQVHLRGGSADHDGPAASTSEARKRQHCARPGHVSFDERSHELATLEVESFGSLG